MSSHKDLAILKQIRQEENRNRCVLEDGRGCSEPRVTGEGWTEITESVVAEDHLITRENILGISREYPPSRSPLL